MKPYIYHYPRPARDYKRAALIITMLALSAAISASIITIIYVILN